MTVRGLQAFQEKTENRNALNC